MNGQPAPTPQQSATPAVFLCLLVAGLLAYFAVKELLEEIRYSTEGQRATARVENVTRTGRMSRRADVSFEADGQRVKATLSHYFLDFVGPHARGEEVAILYLPDTPKEIRLDSTWARFHALGFGLLLAASFILLGGIALVRDYLAARAIRRFQEVARRGDSPPRTARR